MEKLNSLWLDKKQRSEINITQITPNDIVTTLGGIVDKNLSMDKHIVKVPRAVCVSVRNIGMI